MPGTGLVRDAPRRAPKLWQDSKRLVGLTSAEEPEQPN
ncbi:hypothetical protein JOF53_001296 [Crossiella equi]|uniref:Uncharacterized protein n=1 Tax=Crossiella equi TaxID=130796 RepID=A0ABS5A746_9PSEU|nr:hypothetical protein [Crossiella equi]